MNPIRRFRNYFIGDIIAHTDDVFLKARAQVLFSFTVFFFVLNVPYSILAVTLRPVHMFLALTSSIGLLLVLFILKKHRNVRLAVFFYIFVHCFQNVMHWIMDNGQVEGQGILFFLLVVLFTFLLLGRGWGFIVMSFAILLFVVGNYNMTHSYTLWKAPPEWHDPVESDMMRYLTTIPFMLNVFLVSQFVKASQKAEQQISRQKELMEKNNRVLEEQRKDILSSITYARRIQHAVLPIEETITRSIPLSFILYRPRDIVSGDFYWFHEPEPGTYILVCADCTGHGVPGAFMTVIGSNLLTQIVAENKITSPSAILTELDKRIMHTLKQEKIRSDYVHDGMDLSLLKVNKNSNQLIYASAKRPALLIRDRQVQELKGSKHSLGGIQGGDKQFNEISMDYRENDILYLFTDGYIDQFGGKSNKKFMIKRFRELLLSICSLGMDQQKQKLDTSITDWIGRNEQTDDITVIGIRF